MTDPRTILTEQLLQQTDHPTRPGVYILELDSPGPSLHAHARRWYDEYQTVHPDGVCGLAGTERLLYVGATNNLQERLEDHVQGKVYQSAWRRPVTGRAFGEPVQGEVYQSAWLDVYPPAELIAAIPQPTPSLAFVSETQIAHNEARGTPETTAVICNGEVVG